ncbi:BQ2448_3602 [Microbotryum intermedium]|uniref:BQ2448_3602 protein n=1 Tax=Microbotryum intermedium TaxID=269621 RepID=A0A238FAF9_9BASI|nr:BQ2448_3602 [Microbotryum intermedium]
MLPPLQGVQHLHHTASGAHHQHHHQYQQQQQQHQHHPYRDHPSDPLVDDLGGGGGSGSASRSRSSSSTAPYDPPHSASTSSADHQQHQRHQQQQQQHPHHQHPQHHPHRLPPMFPSPYGARSDRSPSQATSSKLHKLGKDGLPKKKRKQGKLPPPAHLASARPRPGPHMAPVLHARGNFISTSIAPLKSRAIITDVCRLPATIRESLLTNHRLFHPNSWLHVTRVVYAGYVKCDKAEMGGGACSECLKKHIKCTDAYVKSKPKVVRSGKLIQQAKTDVLLVLHARLRKLYGNGEDGVSGDGQQSEAAGEDMESNEVFDGLLYGASDAIKTSAESSATGVPDHCSPPPTAPPLSLITGPQSRIILTHLGLAVQDHLVQTYYSVFQAQMHVVDWPVFQQTWDNAGRNAAAMSPTNEFLAVVIQAWAARFSDHPVVLGQKGALTLPTLNDVRHHSGRDFTDVGNRREPFARAMLDRALKVCDERGALRKASAACCYALLLLEFLMVWDNSGRAPSSAGRSMMVNCAEHLRSMNEPSYVSADPDEVVVPTEQISGGTLLWMMYTRDALAALMQSRTLCLTDEDLAGLSDLLAIRPHASEIMATVSSDNPQMLLGLAVVCVFRHLTNSIRECAKTIASPLARRMRLNEVAIREAWADLDQSIRYTAIFKESVSRMDWTSFPTAKAHAWFRDVTVMHAQIALGVHSVVLDRWTLESNDERDLARDPTYAGYVDMLHRLKCESDERLLTCIREVTKYYRGVNHCVVFEGVLSSEFMKDYLQHMLRSPTWEEDGPANWTWEDKKLHCDDAIKALRNGGWCWPGYDVVIVDAIGQLANEAARIEQIQRRRTGSAASTPGPFGSNQGGSAGCPDGAWRGASGTLPSSQQHLRAPGGTGAAGFSPASNPAGLPSPSSFSAAAFPIPDQASPAGTSVAAYGFEGASNPIATDFAPPSGPPPSADDKKLAHLLGNGSDQKGCSTRRYAHTHAART